MKTTWQSLVCAGLVLCVCNLHAAESLWTGAASGSWLDANWNPAAPTAVDSVVYTNNGAINLTQTLDTNWTVAGLVFKNLASPVVINPGAGTFKLSVTNTFNLSAAGADLTINADFATPTAIQLGNNRTLTISNRFNNILSASGNGTLVIKGYSTNSQVGDLSAGAVVVLDGATNEQTFLRFNPANGYTVRYVLTNNAYHSYVGTAGSALRMGNVALSAGQGATNILDMYSGTFAFNAGQILLGAQTYQTAILNMKGGYFVDQSSATLVLGAAVGATGIVHLDGGVLEVPRLSLPPVGSFGEFNFNGGVFRTRYGGTTFWPSFSMVNAYVRSGGAIIDSNGKATTWGQALLDGGGNGGLTMFGNGTITLSGNNTYTGPTVVSNGLLQVDGQVGPGAVTVYGALGGQGTVSGPVNVLGSGTLSPGDSAIGNLSINNTLNLAGKAVFEVSMDAGTNDEVLGLSSVAYGGSLVITNTGGAALTAGLVFKLFDATSPGSGNFANITVLPDVGLTGSFDPATGEVTLGATPPPTLGYTQIGGNFTFTWTGSFKLQSQTNNLGAGLSTNWSDYLGGDVSGIVVPVDTTQESVFFRLISQ